MRKYKIAYIDEGDSAIRNFLGVMEDDFDLVLVELNEEYEHKTLELILEEIFEENIDIIVTDYKLNDTNIIKLMNQ